MQDRLTGVEIIFSFLEKKRGAVVKIYLTEYKSEERLSFEILA